MSDQDKGQEPTPEVTEATPEVQETKAEPKVFDESYVKELRAEAAKNRKAAQEATAKVEQYEEANKTEAEKKDAKIESLTSENGNTKAENLRLLTALEKNLPVDLIDRLKGDTKEDLEADADKLLSLVKSEPAPDPEFDGGARDPSPDPKSPDEAHNELVSGLFGPKQT